MPKERKKITFSGSLARRILILCAALLILPLFLHTFLLYRHERILQEGEVRSAMNALGLSLAGRIDQQIQLDWKVLDGETPDLVKSFQIQKMSLSKEVPDHFVQVSAKREALLVGKKGSSTEAHIIVHPLAEVLKLEEPPFPIDMTLGKLEGDLWMERFPIRSGGLTLTMGTSPERIQELQWNRLLLRIGTFLFLILFVGGGLVWWLGRKLSHPLEALQLTMQRVAEGAVHSRYAPQMWGFEINAIGREFNETLDQVIESQNEAMQERLEREKLAYELKVGREIQASLLPQTIPSVHGLKMAPGYLPAKEVRGDFYDVFPLSPGKVMIAIGDVAGKGISACLYSIALRSTLRSLAEATNDLSQLARQANDLFLLDVKESGFFATLWIGICDGRHLSYASFGHPPALLKQGKEIVELSTGHPAFGIDPFRRIETGTTVLEAGDTLLLYTDGVTEAHDPNGKLFGMNRLKEVLLKQSKPSPEPILQEIVSFSQGAPQHDDIAILLLHVP